MPEPPFEPVRTLADLDTLDEAEIIEGYRDYRPGDPEPGANRGRAYWHGWTNRRDDDEHRTPDASSLALTREWLARERVRAREAGAARQPMRRGRQRA